MRRLLIAANWKMNTTCATGTGLSDSLANALAAAVETVDVLLCPPFVYIVPVAKTIADCGIQLGAQDSYFEKSGAFTGEISNQMLHDVGCEWVILGHSERRHVMGETNELVNKKVLAALDAGLQVILCVGELLSDREGNLTTAVLDEQMDKGLKDVNDDQMDHVTIAYEPVWAIGTGVTATVDQAESAQDHLRKWLANRYNSEVSESVRILYGGSVKGANASDLMRQPNVDGALVGGASLETELFVPIVEAAVELTSQKS